MSTLHTLSALPGTEACTDCLRLLAEGDALLLLGDGVHAAALTSDIRDIEVYVLASDALARGVTALPGDVAQIDMPGFVELTEHHARQMAWY